MVGPGSVYLFRVCLIKLQTSVTAKNISHSTLRSPFFLTSGVVELPFLNSIPRRHDIETNIAVLARTLDGQLKRSIEDTVYTPL